MVYWKLWNNMFCLWKTVFWFSRPFQFNFSSITEINQYTAVLNKERIAVTVRLRFRCFLLSSNLCRSHLRRPCQYIYCDQEPVIIYPHSHSVFHPKVLRCGAERSGDATSVNKGCQLHVCFDQNSFSLFCFTLWIKYSVNKVIRKFPESGRTFWIFMTQ